jgi:spermidine synthase
MAGSQVEADLWINEYISPWDIYSHGITQILAYKKTQYQEMYVVESGEYGKALVLDGKWQSCTGDEFIYHETLVHPALIAHKNPKSVLILGGGEGATIREVLRWKTIERVMMIDIDGEVVQACKDFLPEMHQNAFDDPRVELVIADALEVLDTTTDKWDIIISDLCDPIEEGPSYPLFTQEYFQKLQRVLAPNGYVVVQSGPIAPPKVMYHARLVNTLKSVFPHVQSMYSPSASYGSPWGFALCSNENFSTMPDPQSVDLLLQEKTTGGFRLIDGISLLGAMQTPLYVRSAFSEYPQVYTLKEPPKFFGKGVVEG